MMNMIKAINSFLIRNSLLLGIYNILKLQNKIINIDLLCSYVFFWIKKRTYLI